MAIAGERETEKEMGTRESARGFHGRAWRRWRRPGDEGEAAGSRRWPGACRRASATRAVYWHGEEDDRGGLGGLGRPLGPPGGSLSFLMFLFSTFCNCFCFIKNARAFSKILKIFVGTIEIIPNSPQLVSELLEHLNYL